MARKFFARVRLLQNGSQSRSLVPSKIIRGERERETNPLYCIPTQVLQRVYLLTLYSPTLESCLMWMVCWHGAAPRLTPRRGPWRDWEMPMDIFVCQSLLLPTPAIVPTTKHGRSAAGLILKQVFFLYLYFSFEILCVCLTSSLRLWAEVVFYLRSMAQNLQFSGDKHNQYILIFPDLVHFCHEWI